MPVGIITATDAKCLSNMANMTIAERIRRARTVADLSQTDLATKLGVSRAAIAQWETGRSGPDRRRIADLAEALRVTVDYLLGVSDDGSIHLPRASGGTQENAKGADDALSVFEARAVGAGGAFIITGNVVETLQRPPGAPVESEAFGFRLPVKPALARYNAGDLLIVSPIAEIETGDDVVVEAKVDDTFLCDLEQFRGVTVNDFVFEHFFHHSSGVYAGQVCLRAFHTVNRLMRIYSLASLLQALDDTDLPWWLQQTNRMPPATP